MGSEDNHVDLYRRVVSPEHPGLYFIGLIQPLGAVMPLAEEQAHSVADLIAGDVALPSAPEMREQITAYEASGSATPRFGPNPRRMVARSSGR